MVLLFSPPPFRGVKTVVKTFRMFFCSRAQSNIRCICRNSVLWKTGETPLSKNSDSNFVSQPPCGQERRDNVKRPFLRPANKSNFYKSTTTVYVACRHTTRRRQNSGRTDNAAQRRLQYRRNRSQHIVPSM